MLHIGSEFGIILNDPQLRAGLIAEAERWEQSKEKVRSSLRLRFGLARVLRAVAIRIEPRIAAASEPGANQPVFAD